MWILIVLFIIIIVVLWYLFKKNKNTKIDIVPEVDLNRYAGVWYENARLPVPYQTGCKNAVAIYTLRPDNILGVVNQCEYNGNIVEVRGTAVPNNSVLDPTTKILKPGSLKVVFENSPVSGDYNIIYLDEFYQYSVVGTPDKKSLWILSRTPKISDDTYKKLINRINNMGYDTTNIIRN